MYATRRVAPRCPVPCRDAWNALPFPRTLSATSRRCTSVRARTRDARTRERNDARSTPDTRLARADTRAPIAARQRRHPPRYLLLRSFSVTWIDAARARARQVHALLPLLFPRMSVRQTDGRTGLRSIVYFRQCARAPRTHEVVASRERLPNDHSFP